MAKRVFVTATNTGIGKTYATLRLINESARKKLLPGVLKPIETGVVNIPQDGKALFQECKKYNKNFEKFRLEDIVPYRYSLPAAPYVAKKEESINIDKIFQALSKIEKECDLLFIEGAGGVMVPIEKDYYMIDLIRDLKAAVLLVTPSRLGSINDTLLSMEALRRRGIEFEWCVNLYEDKESFFEITYPFYRDNFERVPILQYDSSSIIETLVNIRP